MLDKVNNFLTSLSIKSDKGKIHIDPNYLHRYIKKGIVKISLEQYEEAIKEFTLALKLQDFFQAYYHRAFAYEKLNMLDEAISDYTSIISLKATNSDFYVHRGILFFKNGNSEKALSDFNFAIFLDDNQSAYYPRAYLKYSLNDFEEALKDYDYLVEKGTGSSVIYFQRGLIKKNLLLYQDAISDFEEALLLNPEEKDAIIQKAECLVRIGQYEEAKKNFETALVNNNNDPNIYLKRGFMYWEEKNHDLALEDFNTAIILQPDLLGAYYGRALIKYDLGEYEKALEDLISYLKISIDDNIIEFLIPIYHILYDLEKIVSCCDILINNNPYNPNPYFFRGQAKLYLKKYEEAFCDAEMFIKLSPDDYNGYILKAESELKAFKNYEQAETTLKKAIELEPKKPEAYLTLAKIKLLLKGKSLEKKKNQVLSLMKIALKYTKDNNASSYSSLAFLKRKIGSLNSALEDINKAIEINPNNYNFYFERALIEYENQNYDNALVDLKNILEQYPNNAKSYNLRAKIHESTGNMLEAESDFAIANSLGYVETEE